MDKLQPLRTNAIMPDREIDPHSAYNKLVVTHRVCSKFARSKENRNICKCGRPRDDPIHENKEDELWTMEQHSVPIIDPVHGKLINGAWFARLALDTPERKAEQILVDTWKIRKPRLIMSILGGAKYFTLSDRLESNFINNIIRVARSSNAWLITNGYNVGIVQVVGQAIKKAVLTDRKNNLVAIAVSKWGCVRNVERLIANRPGRQAWNDRPEHERTVGEQHQRRKGERDLDLNHTHYLMVDDGRLRHYDMKDYRTKLCLQIAKYHEENASPVPIVSIVVEGGKDTIRQMYYDLHESIPVVIIDGSGRVADFFKRWLEYTKKMDDQKRPNDEPYEIDNIDRIPEEDTARASESKATPKNRSASKPKNTAIQVDLLHSTNTLQGTFHKHEELLKKDLDEVLSQEGDSKDSNESDGTNKRGFGEICKQVMFCLQPAVRWNISIFNLGTDTNLSEAIFRSICKARQKLRDRKDTEQAEVENRKQQRYPLSGDEGIKKKHAVSQQQIKKKDQDAQRTDLLELAMDWNCIDVARELILKNSLDNILNHDESFIFALRKNLPTFIYEFLKLGIQPSEIFYASRGQDQFVKFFQELYSGDFRGVKTTHLASFIQVAGGQELKQIPNVGALNNVLRNIIGDHMEDLYFYSDDKEGEQQQFTGPRGTTTHLDSEGMKEHWRRKDDLIMRDLFIWAVLHNYIDMAKVFLAHIKYRICAALIATKILKQYHSIASHGELKKGYKNHAEYFEQYAIDCINQCEVNDSKLAGEIVLQQIDLFGNVTCLQVAADADDKSFVATPCCVQAIRDAWNDKIDPGQSEGYSWFSIVVGFWSFGLLAPLLITYREVSKYAGKEPKPRLKSYGINYSDPFPLEHPHYIKAQPTFNRYIHQLINFHSAPFMKYLYRCLFYCFFLLLFSYVLLFKFEIPTNQTPSIDWTEILTIVIISCMLIEETHYFWLLDNLTLGGRLHSYYTRLFKVMAMLSFALFFIGLILRFTLTRDEDNFTAARIVMGIAVEIFWLRSLAFIIVLQFLGPSLVAIGKLLKDLLFFMCIIAVVMLGYGVASRSIVYYPHQQDYTPYNSSLRFDGRTMFRDIVYPVYYLLHGTVQTELTNFDTNPDAGYSIATHVLLAIHMIFVNILLVNLLIAMFSKRYDQVYDDTRNIWHSQKYILTREYYSRAPLFPPFSVLYDLYQLIRMSIFYIRKKCNGGGDPHTKVFKMIAENIEQINEWGAFEGASTYEYAHAQVKESRDQTSAATAKSESGTKEKKDDASNTKMGSYDSADDIKKLQDDVARVNLALDRISQQLKVMSGENNKTPTNHPDQNPRITSQ